LCVLVTASGLTSPARAYTQLASFNDSRSHSEVTNERAVGEIAVLVEALSARRFVERRQATERLKGYGPEVYPDLVRVYRGTRSPEVRLRIKRVAAHIYFREQAGRQEGFLGIQPQPVTRDDDDRLPPGETGIMVVRVLADTAAERVGLRPDDVIVRFDDKPIPADRHGTAFTQLVRMLRPDTLVRLVALRGAERLVLRARLSARPLDAATTADAETADRTCARWFRDRFERGAEAQETTATVRADAERD